MNAPHELASTAGAVEAKLSSALSTLPQSLTYPVPFQKSYSTTQPASGTTTVEIVVPAYNEERALPGCLRTLHARLQEELPFSWRITVADNASTDRTFEVAQELAAELPGVGAVRLGRKGKGLALRTVWGVSDADIVAYMDVDLSTGLSGFLPLIAPLASGHSDLAIGSRLAPGAQTQRGIQREFISRAYNSLIRFTHGTRFSDGQCGFKAARTEVVRPLLEATRDDGFFFDTELLILADYNGLRVHEVAVDWVEDLDSRVDVARTSLRNISGLWRMARLKASGGAAVPLPPRPAPIAEHPDAVLARERRGIATWEIGCFLAIGVASTAGHAVLYWLMRMWWSPLLANLVAQTVLTVINTEANRRLTFRGSLTGATRAHTGGIFLFAFSYLVTVGAVAAYRALASSPSRISEVFVLSIACCLVTIVRFVAMKFAVFTRRR
ncbi:glycosyltransferase involved in cell wall biosynthesis [Streptomyces sp. V4I8]|uniref:glycosyltransferase n=1 Tax=Streptomyces sp. V4I8 TaxID=3156469 RepID=UPI003514B8A9